MSLLTATFDLHYYPPEWKRTETTPLQKPADGMAQLLNRCIAKEVSSKVEALQILPPNHFGARPGRSTTDTAHMLARITKDAWREGEAATALLLSVKGAFPSVAIKTVIHDMRQRGIPPEITGWMERRYKVRTTILSFDRHTSEPINIRAGLDQGDPNSGNVYIFYNADIFDIADHKRGEHTPPFVSDATVITKGKTFDETHEKLRI